MALLRRSFFNCNREIHIRFLKARFKIAIYKIVRFDFQNFSSLNFKKKKSGLIFCSIYSPEAYGAILAS